MFPFIYLASQSPRRQELLKQIGVKFEMLAPAPGEDSESIEASRPHEKARDYVERVTLAKSAAALERHIERALPWAPILCADTTVSLSGHISGEILGKPFDAVDAERILKLMSGQTHQVLTAIALRISPTSEPVSTVQISEVTFTLLSEDQSPNTLPLVKPLVKPVPMGFRDSVAPSLNPLPEAIAVSWAYLFLKPLSCSISPK